MSDNLPARLVHEGEVLDPGETVNKPYQPPTVLDFGARSDGIADDTAAIVAAAYAGVGRLPARIITNEG